ncbi:BRO-N domain-containing protein [Sedimentibacter saalensis]|uniref:BRO-N domain-containing protein n=1 Tax=Sedimentibacter saalensis TaxID=130788 RepID=UPI0028982CE9|nr:Bro-N domain-containing protein [Sedimentibacter saalensis]
MDKDKSIKLFEQKTIRTHWDEEQEKWFFSIQDVVEVLADTPNPKDYIKKMKRRDEELAANWGTICPLVEMIGADGRRRKIQAADTQGLLRLIQSIPSKKAEPFKMWLAQVGSERLDETADPELAIERALETYLKKGYSQDWINQRLKTIEVRKALTDEWDSRGVTQGLEYAILTDEITRAWSGKTTQQYKVLKGLKKENLRDNMSNVELILNMLAEASTTEISQNEKPETFEGNKSVARKGGKVAKAARVQLEKTTGKSVVTNKNAKDLQSLPQPPDNNENEE